MSPAARDDVVKKALYKRFACIVMKANHVLYVPFRLYNNTSEMLEIAKETTRKTLRRVIGPNEIDRNCLIFVSDSHARQLVQQMSERLKTQGGFHGYIVEEDF